MQLKDEMFEDLHQETHNAESAEPKAISSVYASERWHNSTMMRE